MNNKRILAILEEKQPIEREALFKLLKAEDTQFSKDAFKQHIFRLKKTNKITEMLNGLLTVKKFMEVIS
jgi:hypothetical protein